MKKLIFNSLILILIIIMAIVIPKVDYAAETTIKLGDVNNNGTIDNDDILCILKHISAKERNNNPSWILTGRNLIAANTTKDTDFTIDIADILKILRYIATTRDKTLAEKHKDWTDLGEVKDETVTIDDPITPLPINIEVKDLVYSTKSGKIKVGQSITETAKVSPANATDKTITYTSSNPEIATVDKGTGKITGKKAGTTTIKARSNNGKEAVYTVTVENQVVSNPIKKFVLKANDKALVQQNTTLSLNVKEKMQITYDVSPTDAKITYISSKPEYASISKKGLIKGLKKGTTIITATATSSTKETSTFKFKVNVKIPVKTVTIKNEKKTVKEISVSKDKKVTLTATVSPSNVAKSDQKVTWKSKNEKIATVTSKGVIKGVKIGSTVITATAGGVTTQCKVKVVNPPKLNKTKATIYIGDKIEITASTTESKIKWTIPDSKKSIIKFVQPYNDELSASKIVEGIAKDENKIGNKAFTVTKELEKTTKASNGKTTIKIEGISLGSTTLTATTPSGASSTFKVTVGTRKEIKIDSSDTDFYNRTKEALNVLKKDKEGYNEIVKYLGCIKKGTSSYYGMEVFAFDTPTFVINKETYAASNRDSDFQKYWYAACIRHDANHSKMYYDAESIGYNGYIIYQGIYAEWVCTIKQINTMNKLGNKTVAEASESNLGYDWWSESNPKIWWDFRDQVKKQSKKSSEIKKILQYDVWENALSKYGTKLNGKATKNTNTSSNSSGSQQGFGGGGQMGQPNMGY